MTDHRTILTLAALLCGVASVAQAEEGVFMKNTLSNIGLIEPERPTITYRERAPLVLPPKAGNAALPPPVPRSAVREATPQWPTDPEVAARAKQVKEARKPITRGEQGRMNDNNMTLSIHEMRAGRREGAGVPTEPTYKPGDNVRESTWLNPLQLLQGRKDDTPVSDVEPSRDVLTDPPTGYRAPPNGRLARAPEGPRQSISEKEREEADPRAYLRSRAR
ncbi:hypothetical protein [Methylobacterium oryzisoli]|uniref:hypothetical protein n=1 Tax=Methylobacterium oryzisoli TaxID=3385502 RepID=UPI003892BB57